MLEQSGGSMWSLEHDEFWHRRAQKALDRFRIRSVDLFHAPLTNYGDYSWYGVTGSLLPNSISLVICDGPPSGTPGGRYGAVPFVRDRLQRGAVVLLDDAERAEEQAIATRWAEEFESDVEILGKTKPYARIVVC